MMKCVKCAKDIDLKPEQTPPPTWYGKFSGGKYVSVICAECIKDPKNREEWRRDG